ncbi:MAG TPA: sigma-70 family RNA polymerase sigma factor [Actinomycetota bacterium]|nr:sigma-70 family RNA polymerase sigma factor [Actinomycetota bacterium]
MSASDTDTPDEALVRRFLGGDRAAFAELARRHERRVYSIAYRMLGSRDDASDATQEVFLTCLRKLSAFRAESAFTTWLHRVTVNTCYDVLRRRSREAPATEELPDTPVPDRTDAAGAGIDLQRALSAIPEEFRAVIVLHDLADQSYESIAETLGAPLGTVKSRLHRGRVLLARILRGEPSGDERTSNPERA